MFDARSMSVLAYNLETILAEKLETILSRNIANTRPRDFYDVYILYTLRGSECNRAVLQAALGETAMKRGSVAVLRQYESIGDAWDAILTLLTEACAAGRSPFPLNQGNQ